MASIFQQVVIEWHSVEMMPKEEGTYLVAFSDGTVETYPISERDIQTGVIQDGYARGLFWAENITGPV
jgi:hypothetical protein